MKQNRKPRNKPMHILTLDFWKLGTANNEKKRIVFFFKGFFFRGKDFLFIYLFIYFWLCWVFVCARAFSSCGGGGHSSLRCTGLSLSRPHLLRGTSSRRAGSVVVAHGLSCSAACGIFPDQGSNPCALHWQADSQPLRHQGSQDSILDKWCWVNYISFWRKKLKSATLHKNQVAVYCRPK